MIKVLMLTNDYLPNIGGMAAHVYHLTKAMRELGLAAYVAHVVEEGVSPQPQFVLEQEDGMPVYRCYRSSRIRHRWRRGFDIIRFLLHLWREIGSFTIIHSHDYLFTAGAVKWFRRKYDAKWVWTNHSSGFLQDIIRDPVRRAKVARSYSHVDGLIAVSPEILARSAEIWGANRIMMQYIPNGVDTRIFYPRVKEAKMIPLYERSQVNVLCPRRIVPKNGVIYFAEAARIIADNETNVQWHFWLTGDLTANASYAQSVIEVLRPLMLRGKVSLLGPVPHSEMPEVYAISDVVVIPSLVEAVSLSALEALAMGIPVVATNVGGLPEVIRHEETGLLVSPGDPQGIAQAVYRIYSEANLASNLRNGALELVSQNYTWQKVALQTVDFYQRCLGR